MSLDAQRRVLTLLCLLGLLWASGCDWQADPSPAPPTSSSTAAGRDQEDRQTLAAQPATGDAAGVVQQSLDAETLADLLGVEAWRFNYAGGPGHCWLEIEEVGQETMPPRLPEKGTLQLDRGDEQIVLSWRRTLSGYGGGAIRLSGGGTVYALDLDRRSFTYDWNGSRVTSTPQGKQRRVPDADGEWVLMTYHARETVAEGETPRDVTLTLKLRRGVPTPPEA